MPGMISLGELAQQVQISETNASNSAVSLSDLARNVDLRKQLLAERVAGELLGLFRTSVLFTTALTAADADATQ